MNTRPVPVATHSVPPFLARVIAATAPPRRSAPYAGVGEGEGEGWRDGVSVRSVAPAGPSGTKSPQVGGTDTNVKSLQFASRKAWSPPQSWVRQTLCDP